MRLVHFADPICSLGADVLDERLGEIDRPVKAAAA